MRQGTNSVRAVPVLPMPDEPGLMSVSKRVHTCLFLNRVNTF